jgi:integrase
MKAQRLKTNKAGDKIDQTLLNIPGKHCDGAGLYLSVARDEESRRAGLPLYQSVGAGGASYLFRHKNKEASIGSAHVYSIKHAREMAAKLWQAACEGEDPFALLKTLRAGPAAVGGKTFAEAMTIFLDANAATLTASNRDRTRRDYEYQFEQVPDFMKLPLKAIDQTAKNAALAHWNDRPGLREKVGYYIGAIINYDATGKLKLKRSVIHHNPMPYAMVPAFYARLGALGTVNAKALQWTILSGARTDEVIGSKTKPAATWGEIKKDTDGKLTWIVPDTRIKTKSVFRVPLSKQMEALLGKRQADNVVLFKVSNPDALRDTLKACDGNGYHVHGFRTSFQNWILEKTDYPPEIADMCIHVDKRDKNQKTYQQSNLLAKRRDISQRWSKYLAGKA